MRLLPSTALAACVVLASACAEQSPTAPEALSPSPSMHTAAGGWASVVTGETGPGSSYALYMPAAWNGDVVYYAHGILPAAAPVGLPTGDGFPGLRDALGARGYAVAYSSFSENGWAVKDGAERTHQLRGLFTARFGAAKRSYLVGTSMGGLIAQKLAEDFPTQYDGTLAMCAPLAGAKAELDYIANVRVLFDLMYPGVVPGDVLHVPTGIDLNTQVLGPAQAAVVANPTGLGLIARVKQTPLAGNDGVELITSLLYALTYDVIGIDDFLGRTHGHPMFDNSATTYDEAAPGLLGAPTLGYVNGYVGRFTATPDALRFLSSYYQPTARLTLPTVTLHTTRDPLVPWFHEPAFAQAATAAGSSALLLQRPVDAFGHCTFTTPQMTDAFDALATWTQTGVKPTA